MRATRHIVFATVVALLSVAIAVPAAAQGMRWRGSGGWGPNSQFGRMYNPQSVETLTGEVTRVDQVTPMKGMGPGVHITLKTEGGPVSVHLGPSWYLENQDVKIAPGDRLEVKGSRVDVGGKPAIIAAEVKKGDETLRLRDEAGVPVWSGWRRG
jgi:hypothetical protein